MEENERVLPAKSAAESATPSEPVITEDPDAPVTIDDESTNATEPLEPEPDTPTTTDDEPAPPKPSEPVITEDPDTPVTVDADGTDDEPAPPKPSEPVITEDPDAPVTVDPDLTDHDEPAPPQPGEPAITEDPDAPVTVDTNPASDEPASHQPGEPVLTEDPDAPVTVDADTTDHDEPAPPQPGEPDLTDAPDEDTTEPEQLLMATDNRADQAESTEAHLLALLEAVVYVTDEPLTLEQMAKAVSLDQATVKAALDKLVEEFNKPHHGLTVREVAGGFKMTTKPEHHEAVRTFVKNLNPPLKLSLAALETLAVIAYKQPITAPEIMEIRGVQGAGVLKTLLDRKLITTAGRKNVVGKPILYKTTKEFLVQFGLRDLNELPTLKEFEDLRRMAFADDGSPVMDSVGPTPDDTEAPAEGVEQPSKDTQPE